jgi:TRAP-type mannitol/chloroaromatic compound transport system permease small subunit
VYLLPVVLVVLYLALGLLGAHCSDDLLDNSDYSCNTGGEVRWVIAILTLLSLVGAGVMLLTDLAGRIFRRIGRTRR